MVEKSFGTHDGSFHADEVTACALLQLFGCVEATKIVRSRDEKELARCEYVCDVGGVYDPAQKRFDHHQITYQGLLSSAGMVLLHLKEEGVIDPSEYQFLNQTLILGVDAQDNGREASPLGVLSFSALVAHLNPVRYNASSQEMDRAFDKAVAFVLGYLQQLRERFMYAQSCKETVRHAMESACDCCLLFSESLPWQELFFELGGAHHPALFVIMPSGSHWKLRCIPPSLSEKMRVRHPLPIEWAGLSGEQLHRVSGIKGAIFCHKGRFISVWETLQDALLALLWILKKEGKVIDDHDFWKNYSGRTTG